MARVPVPVLCVHIIKVEDFFSVQRITRVKCFKDLVKGVEQGTMYLSLPVVGPPVQAQKFIYKGVHICQWYFVLVFGVWAVDNQG